MGIKFTEDEKIQFVEDWRTSGLNKKKYAEQNGLVYNSFKTWKDKTKETQKKNFVETPSINSLQEEKIKVRKNGIEIEFPAEMLEVVLEKVSAL